MVPKVDGKVEHDWKSISHITYSLEDRRVGTQRWTLDYFELKKQKWHPIFIFGNHQPGGIHSKYLEGMRYLGVGRTATNGYIAKNYRGIIPILYRNSNSTLSSYVIGDVFLADANHILDLDRYMMNGVHHHRETSHIKLLDQKIIADKKDTMKPIIPCFIWITSVDTSKNIPPSNLHPIVKVQTHGQDQRFGFEWPANKIKEKFNEPAFDI